MKKFAPLGILVSLMVAAYLFGVADSLTFQALKDNRAWLIEQVELYPVRAPLLFMILYAITTALSLPTGTVLSVAGGFLFDQPLSLIFVLIGATTGAAVLFLIAKTAIGAAIRKKAGHRINNLREGFKENAASYLLFLRLVPIFPFWLVNLAPAFFDVKFSTFLWTTLLGITPGAFAITQAGVGLASILEKGEKFSVSNIFTVEVRIALIALAFLVLMPPIVKWFRKKYD